MIHHAMGREVGDTAAAVVGRIEFTIPCNPYPNGPVCCRGLADIFPIDRSRVAMRDRILFCVLFVLLLFTLHSAFGADLSSSDRHTAVEDSSPPTPTAPHKHRPSMNDGEADGARPDVRRYSIALEPPSGLSAHRRRSHR